MMRRLFQLPWRSARAIRSDVDDELAFHLEARAAELERGGLDAVAARRQAEREFGDVDEARSYLTDFERRAEKIRRRRDVMGELRQDLGYALRTLRTAPAFTLTALLTLALGIGATTAIFTLVNGVLLRPLPFPEPDQLLRVWSANPSGGNLRAGVSPLDIDDWRAQKHVIADLGGWFYQTDGGSGIDLTGAGEPQRLGAVFVTPGFFTTLGVAPLAGRLPREDEMVRGGPDRVVVLSHAFWLRQLGGRTGALDSTLTLGGLPYRVLGVMPPSFRFPAEAVDVYVPYSTIPDDAIPRLRVVRILDVVARVGRGVSPAAGAAELAAITRRLAQQYPDENGAWTGATVLPLREAVVGSVQSSLWVLLGAVGFVLLLTAGNVAGLLLARGAARGREMAIRAALGAGRGRIIRQLVTESLVLALLGGVLGLGVAKLGTDLLLRLAAGQLPRTGDVRLDGTVLAFALLLSLGTGLLFGLVPALRVGSVRIESALREGGRGAVGGGQRLRNALVVAQVAVAVVLVTGAGLMTRSFVALLRVDPGFRADHLVAVNFTISTSRHPEYAQFYHDVIDRVRAIPGVVSAGAAKNVPFRGSGEQWSFVPPGLVLGAGEQAPAADVLHISDGYFRTIGARMIAGREFTPQDRADAPPVVVINEALARRYFPAGDAVGRVIGFGGTRTAQIAGVVNDIRQTAMDGAPEPTIYICNMQNTRVKTTLVARTRGEPLAMAGQIRAAIWELDRDQAITSVFTFHEAVGEALARPRLLTVLLGAFGSIGLVLGALGIYGLLAFLVQQRQREIGVRLALGADAGRVLRMVVGRGLLLGGLGVAIGLAGALGTTRVMRSVLFGVGSADPFTFAAVAVMLVAVAALASWLPARRAAAVDPVVALRQE